MSRRWHLCLMPLVAALISGVGPVQVDLHLDTPHQLHSRGVGLLDPGLEAGLMPLRAGRTNVATMVLWPPRSADHWPHVLAVLGVVEAQLAAQSGVGLARSPAQARQLVADGRTAVLLALEGAHGLDTDWRASLATLHDRGLSILGLTWSMSNRFAGSSGDGGGGLSDEGRALVEEARRRGLVIDLSHASQPATLDVCSTSPVPVIASHSGAAAVHDVPRNLDDDEIRCIAGTGGVIGLNFHAPFLGGGGDLAAVADHADHIAAVGGKGAVALGSDFDGMIQVPAGLADASQIPALWAELRRRGWTETEVRGIQGENFMRAWAKVRATGGEP